MEVRSSPTFRRWAAWCANRCWAITYGLERLAMYLQGKDNVTILFGSMV
jgi:glycyl-tRNA synthetase alpha subunit